MDDENIRLRLQMIIDGGQAVEAQLRAVLSIEQQLIETNQRQRAAAEQRTQAAKAAGDRAAAEAQREKGLIESLIAEEKRLTEARNSSKHIRQVQEYSKELVRVQQQLRTLQGVSASATAGMGQGFRSLQGVITQAFGIVAIQRFGKALLDAGDNAQGFAITLNTLLQSKEKADQVAAQAVQLAAKTPFTLKEVQDQIRGLAAYGVEAESLIPTITSLGNIAAAVGTDRLPLLVLAYGQVRAANKITGQEIRQFSESGVNLLEMLAKQGSKSIRQVQKDISAGAVGFRDVERAIAAATGKGGQFFNLMEQRSTTIGGRISNFADAVYQGYVKIESQFDASAKSAVDWGTKTVQALTGSESALGRTWQFVKTLVSAWITYRLVLASVALQQRVAAAAATAAIPGYAGLAVTINGTRYALTGLNTVMRASPFTLIVTGVGLLVTAFQAWKASTVDVTSALGEQETKLRTEQKLLRARVGAVLATNENDRIRLGLIKQLRADYPELLKGLDDEQVKNGVLVLALAAVNNQYRAKIQLARIAYNAERNQAAQDSIVQRDVDAVDRLKREFPGLKIISQDLAGAIAEVEVAIRKMDATSGEFGSEQERAAATVGKYRTELGKLKKEQQALDETVTQTTINQVEAQQKIDAEKERAHKLDLANRKFLKEELKTVKEEQYAAIKQELDLTQARIAAFEAEKKAKPPVTPPTDKADKKYHNDKLTRILNEALAMEDGLDKKLAVSRAEEEIEADKAKFEKKTQAEITTIRLEAAAKRKKILEDDRAESKKFLDELTQAISKTINGLEDSQADFLKAGKKLDDEYAALVFKRQRQNAGTEVEEIKLINGKIFYLNAELNQRKKNGELTANQERELRNEIAKLLLEIDQLREKYNDRELQRINKSTEERKRLDRQATSDAIQLLSSFEDASIKSFAGIITAYAQLQRRREDGEATWKDTAAFALTSVAAGVSGLSSLFSQSYNNRIEETTAQYQAEKTALDRKSKAELESFAGNAQQKGLVEERQRKKTEELDEKFRKKEAALKTKAFNADKVGRIGQALMAGAVAALNLAGTGLGLAGPIVAAGLTALQVGLIASQKPPRFYFKGTEFVDREGTFPDGKDTVPSMLTRGERVVPAGDNKRLRGMTNSDLVKNALLGHRLQPLPQGLHRFILEGIKPERGGSTSGRTDVLLEQILVEQRKQKGVTARIDKRGITLEEQANASRITDLKTQYFR